MKYSIILIFSFLIISFGLLTSCNGDKTLEKQEMVDIKPLEVIEQVTYYITTVDNLRAREGELKSSTVLTKLKEGTIVKYLNQESSKKETVNLRGKAYTEPYLKVLLDGKV